MVGATERTSLARIVYATSDATDLASAAISCFITSGGLQGLQAETCRIQMAYQVTSYFRN